MFFKWKENDPRAKLGTPGIKNNKKIGKKIIFSKILGI